MPTEMVQVALYKMVLYYQKDNIKAEHFLCFSSMEILAHSG